VLGLNSGHKHMLFMVVRFPAFELVRTKPRLKPLARYSRPAKQRPCPNRRSIVASNPELYVGDPTPGVAAPLLPTRPLQPAPAVNAGLDAQLGGFAALAIGQADHGDGGRPPP